MEAGSHRWKEQVRGEVLEEEEKGQDDGRREEIEAIGDGARRPVVG